MNKKVNKMNKIVNKMNKKDNKMNKKVPKIGYFFIKQYKLLKKQMNFDKKITIFI